MIDLLLNNTTVILPSKGLDGKISKSVKNNTPLTTKIGFDPTSPDLHLGHSVVLKKLKDFQDLGHRIVIIIGDFTAMIGDPTGKNKSRPPLSKEKVLENSKTYINQLSKILDTSKISIRYNSEWFEKMNLKEMIDLLSNTTIAQILQRNDFNERFTNNITISLHELIYPILQGYDSLMIDADVELGGNDQLFNCLMGRHLQEIKGKEAQIVLLSPLLRGLNGTSKMSKSENNTINLLDTPNDMYGKAMSIPDELISEYIELVTNFNSEKKTQLLKELSEGVNPMKIKKMVSFNLVEQYHSEKDAIIAENYFENQFQNKNKETKTHLIFELYDDTISIVELCKLITPTESKSQIKRLIENGAVSVNNEKINNPNLIINTLDSPFKLKIGKRSFYEIKKIGD